MCATCGWSEVYDEIIDMLEDPDDTFGKASHFLADVADWIQAKEHVTTNQHSKVMEIKNEYGRD